jgi:hypothetical protein
MEDKDRVQFYSYLPIQLDASCNGYQHLALLTKETKLFDKLNLDISTHDDRPDDFYQYILDKTNKYIENQINVLSTLEDKSEKQEKTLNSLLKLKRVKFDRSIVKKTIMTKSYNASIVRQVENIAKNLDEHIEIKENDSNNKETSDDSNKKISSKNKKKDNNKKTNGKNKKNDSNNKKTTNKTTILTHYTYKNIDVKITRGDILSFVMCLKDVLDIECPKIKELSKYLDEVVKICTKLGMYIP